MGIIREKFSDVRIPFLEPSYAERPNLSRLGPTERKRAEEILARADVLEKSGMTASAERLRNQVRAWCGGKNGSGTSISKREKIESRKATERLIKSQK